MAKLLKQHPTLPGFSELSASDYVELYQPVEPTVNSTASGNVTVAINADAIITAGQLLCLGEDGWLLADADAAATAKGLLSVALESGTIGNPIKVALPGSVIRVDAWAWATVGAPLYVSETAGEITATVPTQATDRVVRVIGVPLTDDCIHFLPSPDYVTYN